MRGVVTIAAFCLTALAAGAEEMPSSPRPWPNPVYLAASPMADPAPAEAAALPDGAPPQSAPPEGTMTASLRPMPRPAGLAKLVEASGRTKDQGLDLAGLGAEAAEEPAPKGKKKKKADKATASKKGSVCGVNAIKGEKIAPIKAKVKGCGLADGVRVTSVSGVRLSQSITVDCATAKALNRWVDEVAQPAFGGDIVELKIAAHYICRTRNNKKGAKISEHGRGKAVDIAGFVLSNGKTLSVLKNYNKTMRKAHKGACGIFGTTLGPGSDGYHEDHLHFDTAGYRSGPYCR